MPKGYWIVHITVTDPEVYPEYVRLDTPVIEHFGGKFLVRGGSSQTPEGSSNDRHVVIEFPDLETAHACYDSDAYQNAAAIRRDSANTDFIIVEGHE